MEKHVQQYVDDFMAQIVAKNPGEKEFHQAVHEVVESLAEYILQNPVLQKMKVLERIAEPERVVMFRVPWLNDKGEIEINKGYRIEMNSAIGPYKGGIRFHSSVNLSILKFLAFEQTFKNSLTTLPMGTGGLDAFLAYEQPGIPFSVLIDADGTVRAMHLGVATAEGRLDALDDIR